MTQGSLFQGHYRGVVSNTGSVAGANLSGRQLAEQQIGIFNVKGIGDPKTVATPNYALHPTIKIGYGNSNYDAQIQLGTFADLSKWYTGLIDGKDIISWEGTKAKRLPEGGTRGEIWAFGYDGVDASKSLEAALDWSQIFVRVHLEGAPIRKAFGQHRKMREYVLDKGCIPESCTDRKVAAELLADRFLELYNKDQEYKKYFKDFAKAYKVKITNPSTPAPSVSCNLYEVTVPCDEGDGAALGRIQSQYAGYQVVRTKREGISSTYQMWRTVAQGAPSAVSLSNVLVTNCADACPSGFTKVNKANVYQVQVNTGVTVPAVTGEISRTKISSQPEREVYLITTATTTSLATVVTDVTATGAPIVTFAGVSQSICNQTTPTTYAWSVVQTAVRGSKQWKLTLADENCNGSYSDRLAELQAAYPYLTISVATNGAGDCATVYTTTTLSDCTTLECGETALFDVKPPVPFERHIVWEPYSEPVPSPDCTEPTPATEVCMAVGIKFETNSFRKDTSEYNYAYYQWDKSDDDPVKMYITIHSHDYTKQLCDVTTSFPVTKLQSAEFERGQGAQVRELERWYKHYDLRDWDNDPNTRELYGLTAVAQAHKYYDEYVLTVKQPVNAGGISGATSDSDKILYKFHIEEGKGKAFEAAMNAYIASINNPKLKPVIL